MKIDTTEGAYKSQEQMAAKDKALAIWQALVHELSCRRGFEEWWEGMSIATHEDITQAAVEVITKVLEKR